MKIIAGFSNILRSAEFQLVDVFTRKVFTGNPTCVVFPAASLGELTSDWMSKVAREMNQPSTSFVDEKARFFRTYGPNGKEYPILSGHSSLGIAAATMARSAKNELVLNSIYGEVALTFDGQMYELALPCYGEDVQNAPREPLEKALGVEAAHIISHGFVMGGKFQYAELTRSAFAALRPNIAAIDALTGIGCFATTEGMVTQQSGYIPECLEGSDLRADFTVRNFIPAFGYDEDIATGSIQVPLNIFWGSRLSRAAGESLVCLQASRRGGFIRSRRPGDGFVYVAGECALSFAGVVP